MKKIPLTQNQFAIIDDEDYERVNQYKWGAEYRKNIETYYVSRRIFTKKINKKIYLHRFILNVSKGIEIDHKNHNGLDNQKHNLRCVTRSQNNMNNIGCKYKTSKYKGVYFNKFRNKWVVQIKLNGKQVYNKGFISEISAANAYNEKAKELFGEFVYLNKIPEEITKITDYV